MFTASRDLSIILRCGRHVHLREEKERFFVPPRGRAFNDEKPKLSKMLNSPRKCIKMRLCIGPL